MRWFQLLKWEDLPLFSVLWTPELNIVEFLLVVQNFNLGSMKLWWPVLHNFPTFNKLNTNLIICRLINNENNHDSQNHHLQKTEYNNTDQSISTLF